MFFIPSPRLRERARVRDEEVRTFGNDYSYLINIREKRHKLLAFFSPPVPQCNEGEKCRGQTIPLHFLDMRRMK